MKDAIENELKIHHKARLIFTGHSLGGSIVNLASL